MSSVLLGIAAGIVFGVASVAMMLPMSFPDKSVALSAALWIASPSVFRLRPTSMAGLGHRPDFWPAAQPPQRNHH
jgi:hypothetical protein